MRNIGACRQCNKEFLYDPKASFGIYCSNKCQQAYQSLNLSFDSLKTDKARKRRLLEKLGHICSVCKIFEWQGQLVPLELDHIDGNFRNNAQENLRLICCNCHAQTSTYKARNKGKGRDFRRK